MSRPALNHLSAAAVVCALAAGSCATLAQTTTAPSPAIASASAARADPLARGDRKFVEEAAQGGMAEVEHGKLAAQRATNAQVKQFAERMVQDHGKANDELKTIAGARGITPPTTVERKHHREMEKLAKLKGADFDRAYVAQEVAYHQSVIDALDKTLVPNAKNAELKALLVKVRPAFVAHLEHARSLQGKLGK